MCLGEYVCGALCDGKIFLWNKDKEKVHFITGLPKVFNNNDKGTLNNFAIFIYKIFLRFCTLYVAKYDS